MRNVFKEAIEHGWSCGATLIYMCFFCNIFYIETPRVFDTNGEKYIGKTFLVQNQPIYLFLATA